jgi:hypothetical protein
MKGITIIFMQTIVFAVFFSQVLVVSAAPTEAEAIVVKGEVTAKAVGAVEPQLVQRGSSVVVGSTVKTAKRSDVLMSAFPGSAVRVTEDNEVILREVDLRKRGQTVIGRKVVLELRKGTVMVAIDKPKQGKIDFTINTPQCVAAARGTVFSTSTEDGVTKAVVLDGRVDCIGAGSDGKEIVSVLPGKKVNIGSGKDGMLAGEPVPATEGELKELMDFLEEAVAKGLVNPEPVAEGPDQIWPLNRNNFAPILTDTIDEPVSP